MATVANPRAVISAEDRTTAVLRKIGLEYKQLDREAGRLFDTLRNGSLLGGALTFGALTLGAKRALDQLDALAERAQALGGVDVEFLSAVDLSAARAGVDSVDTALVKFATTLEGARRGGKEQLAVLRALKVDTDALARGTLSFEDALRQAANGVAGYRDGIEKTDLVADAFGTKQVKLVALLNQGAAGLTKFGGATREQVQGAERLADAVDRLSASWERFKLRTAGRVAPGLADTLEQLEGVDWGQVFRKAFDNPIGTVGILSQAFDELRAQMRGVKAEAENAAGLQRFIAGANALRGAGQLPAPPKRPPPGADGKPAAEQLTEAQRALAGYVEQLERESQKLDEIKESERALALLRANPGVDTPQVRELLRLQVAKVEALRDEVELRKQLRARADADFAAEAAARSEVLELSGALEADRKRRQTEVLERLIADGTLTDPAAIERAVKGIAGIRDEVEQTTDAARELGLVFTSAFEDAIVAGRGLSDVLDAIGQDLLRLSTRKLITEPASDALTGLLKGIGGGGGGFLGAKPGEGLDQLAYKAFTSLFGGGFASGGFLPAGRWGIAGERGPEPIFGGRTGLTVQPTGAASTINVNLPPGFTGTRQAAGQVAAEIARRLAIARRFN